MTADVAIFVDTNVLLYVMDESNPGRQAQAREWVDHLWSSGAGRLSWQVLNECYDNAVRKLRKPPPLARAAIETYAEWGMAEFNLPLIRRAWHWADRANVPYWDALILAAAESQGCRFLLSEDFQEGRAYGPVRVINPFRSDPAALLLQ